MVKNDNNERVRIAIGCQGGGITTAFTAGVLERILKEKENNNYDIVALSGTYGGAICALLAWYGLIKDDRKRAIKLINYFWRDGYAASYWDMLLKGPSVWMYRLQDIIPASEITPYYYPPWAQEYLKIVLEKYIDFYSIESLINLSSPDLYVGAVDVLSGGFKVFKSKSKSKKNEISVDAILASSAIPTLSRAIQVNGRLYWGGSVSQNPPISDFTYGNVDVKPDEIWIIQINPDKRYKAPEDARSIQERSNELAGNLSLSQDIYSIMVINNFIEKNYLRGFKHIEIRKIEMLLDLNPESMLEISQQFIDDLMTYGNSQAEKFIKDRFRKD